MKKDSLKRWLERANSLALAAALPAACVSAAMAQQRPNILYIMCDDMGYGDLSCYGQQHFQTPNIDRLASQGMRMTSAYAGSPVSAPSRACFMTGQHSGHTYVRGNREHWAGRMEYGRNVDYAVVGQEPYDTAHVILPELMKAAGYTTALFGKWAGGYEGSVSTPDKRGIDEFYGYICQYMAHLYFPNFLNRYSRSKGNTGVVREVLEENVRYPMSGKDYFKRTQYSADLIHQAAMEWLDARTPDEPFFGLFTYTLPHAELVQPQDSLLLGYEKRFFHDKTWGGRDRYNESVHTHAQFAAMISRLDAYVGEILAKLKEKGLDENTLVIFTSDNGPHEEGGADSEFFGRDGKLRGLKRQCYEGGIRIPFIVRWPGHVPAGTANDHQLAFYDLMPTFCELLGVACPETDGLSFYPTMLGREGQTAHPFLYWEFHETDQIGLRMGDWKLVVVKGVPRLYDLSKDVHEDHDVAKKHPRLVKEMVGIIRAQRVESPLFPVTMPIPYASTTRKTDTASDT